MTLAEKFHQLFLGLERAHGNYDLSNPIVDAKGKLKGKAWTKNEPLTVELWERHLSGGVGIGGVLEPPQAAPVIIGDDALIGSRCIVAEGARVGAGAVLGAGCILTASIPVIDAHTGEELGRGVVPSWCVAVSATRPRTFAGGDFGMPCVLVVKRLTEGERHDKAALNDILRDHGAAT